MLYFHTYRGLNRYVFRFKAAIQSARQASIQGQTRVSSESKGSPSDSGKAARKRPEVCQKPGSVPVSPVIVAYSLRLSRNIKSLDCWRRNPRSGKCMARTKVQRPCHRSSVEAFCAERRSSTAIFHGTKLNRSSLRFEVPRRKAKLRLPRRCQIIAAT